MKLVSAALGCALLATAPTALAEGTLDLLYVPDSEFGVDFNAPGFASGSAEVDGDGFGLRGMVRAGEVAGLRAEYQTITYEDDDGDEEDVDQLRIGLGLVTASTSGAFLEYNKVDIGDFKLDGFALHGRLAGHVAPQVQLYADVGWAWLEDDEASVDWEGPEYSVGAAVGLSPAFAVLVDYRITELEASEDDVTVEFTFTDLRVGGRIMFGGKKAPHKPKRRKAGKKKAG